MKRIHHFSLSALCLLCFISGAKGQAYFTAEQAAEIRRLVHEAAAPVVDAKAEDPLRLWMDHGTLCGSIGLESLSEKLGLDQYVKHGAEYLRVGTLDVGKLAVHVLYWDPNTILDPNWSYPSGCVVRWQDGLYVAATDIRAVDYHPWNIACGGPTGSCVYPIPGQAGTGTNWVKLVRDGQDGATGPQGPPGLDGIGGLHFDDWSPYIDYTNSTDYVVVVAYDGQWYRLLSNNINCNPAVYTQYWAVTISKGLSGTFLGTNFIYKGEWQGDEQYITNDVVSYNYNLFVVGPTNAQPSIGVAPSVNSSNEGLHSVYWTCLLRGGGKGEIGPQGPKGDPGTVITNITYYTFEEYTNIWKDSLTPTSRLFVAFTTNYFGWSGVVPIGSNTLDVRSNTLYLNGVPYAPGGALTNETDPVASTGAVWRSQFVTTGELVYVTWTASQQRLTVDATPLESRYRSLSNNAFDWLTVDTDATGATMVVNYRTLAAYVSTGVNAAVTNVYLSKLADVDTNGIQNGQVLVKQNEWWVPAAMVAATGGLYDGQWALTGRLSVTNPAALTSAALRVVNVLEVGNPQTGSGAPYFRTSGVIRIYKPDSYGPPSITIQAGFPGRSSDGDMIVITNCNAYSGVHIGSGTPAGANSTVVGGNWHGTYNAWCTYVGAPGGPTMGSYSAAFGRHNSMRVGDYAVSVGVNDGTECAVSNYATKIGAYTGVHGFYGFAAGYAARVYGHSNRLIGSYAIVTNGAGKTLVADKAVDARAVTNSFVVRGEMASLGGTSLCFYAGVIQTNIWGQPALTLTNGARPEWALEVSGTNLYFVAGGVRKRVVLEDL